MKRSELRQYAIPGVRQRVHALETQIGIYYREFPEIFIGKTLPVLLKAETKDMNTWPDVRVVATNNGNGNGHGPSARVSAAKRAWTPERRKRQGRLIRKSLRKMHAARAAKVAGKKRPRIAKAAPLKTAKPAAGGTGIKAATKDEQQRLRTWIRKVMPADVPRKAGDLYLDLKREGFAFRGPSTNAQQVAVRMAAHQMKTDGLLKIAGYGRHTTYQLNA